MRELDAFNGACMDLADVLPDGPGRRIYWNVHGPAAIGKTELANHLHRSLRQADVVRAVEVRPDELEILEIGEALALLRDRFGRAAPAFRFPRFDAAIFAYRCKTRPLDLGLAKRGASGLDLEDLLRCGLEDASKDALKSIAGHLPGLTASTLSAGAAAQAMAGAMSAALSGVAIGAAGYVSVAVALYGLKGLRLKSQREAIGRSPRLEALLQKGEYANLTDYRHALPHLLAEDINAGLRDSAIVYPTAFALLIDGADTLSERDNSRVEQIAEGFLRFMADLDRSFVLTFSRAPAVDWEGRLPAVAGCCAMPELYQTERRPLGGLLGEEVRLALQQHATHLSLADEAVEAVLADLLRGSDGTITPLRLVAYWASRLTP